jgi:squalene synthase HpnC
MGQALTTSDVADYPAAADSVQLDPARPVNGISQPLPNTVEMAFSPPTDVDSAQAFTWQLAHSHYENFSVISKVLPRQYRQDFCNIYAFCRIADDLSDEVHDREESLKLLRRFRQSTLAMYAGQPDAITFSALQATVRSREIPIQPFIDLIDAFEQDQRVNRYSTFEQLLDYCRRSADPVGRLVLYVCGYSDQARQKLSDYTCTALQLANFWQDVRGDLLDRNRIYLPKETMEQFGITEEQLRAGICDEKYRQCIKFEVDRAQAMLDQGDSLLPLMDESVRPQIELFGLGGKAILQAIRRQNYDTLTTRPALSKWQKGSLVFRAMVGKLRQKIGDTVASGGASAGSSFVDSQSKESV